MPSNRSQVNIYNQKEEATPKPKDSKPKAAVKPPSPKPSLKGGISPVTIQEEGLYWLRVLAYEAQSQLPSHHKTFQGILNGELAFKQGHLPLDICVRDQLIKKISNN